MTKAELKGRQIRNPELTVGKTIAKIVDDEYPNVLIIFTDKTFIIIDPDPEGAGVGISLDAWPLEDQDLCNKLSELLA